MPAYIVEAVRSPVGRRGGGLAHLHPEDLAATVLRELVERSGVQPPAIDDVILGCVNSIGAQTGNIARISWLAAGLPESVPGVTVDRRCGSSQQAVDFAVQGIVANAYDLVVAGGIEMMSVVPIGSPASLGGSSGFGRPYGSDGWVRRYGNVEMSQFRAADDVAIRADITRASMEEFALQSHVRAAAAWDGGRFNREVIPIAGLAHDEGIRRDTSLAAMAALKPLREDGRMTPAVASQISDASAALLLASEAAVERYDLTPRARVVASVAVGSNPVDMLTGPAPATQAVLARAGISIDEVDHFEVNEAFASVVLEWAHSTGADLQRTNAWGGAIALGHPLGATGARLMTTLLSRLEHDRSRFGLQVMCEAGGTANATIIERV